MNQYATVMAEAENIRIRVEGELAERWRRMLEDRKISQQKACVALMEFVVAMDPLGQAMLLGQIPASDHAELAKIVLKRLAAKK